MATKTELETKTEEYALHVPKIPRQFIDVFDRDTANGNYGMSAETADTVFEYTALQQKLTSFHDLTFSPEFINRLPEAFRKKT